MIIAFWPVMALIAILLIRNVRFIIARYSVRENKEKLILYLAPVAILGAVLVKMTFSVADLVDAAVPTEVAGPRFKPAGKWLHLPALPSASRRSR
jgi:hypothetical protein